MPQLSKLVGTIPAGAAISNVVDLSTDFVVGLIAPDEWTPAVASISVSIEGDNFYDVFDALGSELIFNITPGVMIVVRPELLIMARYLRLRSGTRDKPVDQEGERRFYCIGSQTVSTRISLNPNDEESDPCH